MNLYKSKSTDDVVMGHEDWYGWLDGVKIINDNGKTRIGHYSDSWETEWFKKISGDFEIEIDDENYFYDDKKQILYIINLGYITSIHLKHEIIRYKLYKEEDFNIPKNKGFILKLKFN